MTHAWLRTMPVLALSCAASSCGPRSEGTPASGTAVVIAKASEEDTEIRVSEEELNRYLDHYRHWDPSLSAARIRRTVLMDFILPMRTVERLVSREERERAVARAEDLSRSVRQAGGSLEAFRRLGKDHGGQEQGFPVLPLGDLSPDVATEVFKTPEGLVTPAVHSIYGSVVIGIVAVEKGSMDNQEMRRIYSVFIPYSDRPGLKNEVSSAVSGLRKRVALIQSRYIDDLSPLFEETRALKQNP